MLIVERAARRVVGRTVSTKAVLSDLGGVLIDFSFNLALADWARLGMSIPRPWARGWWWIRSGSSSRSAVSQSESSAATFGSRAG